jgi:hypothetical protein
MASAYITKKLMSILQNEYLVEEYIKKYGEIVNEGYIEQIKSVPIKKPDAEAAKASGEDPVFEMVYQCPACNKDDVVMYMLRSKSQAIKESIFLVPQYSGVMKYFAVDFNLLQTTVCSQCLFASPDPRDWTLLSKFSGKATPSQLVENTRLLSEIRNLEFERKAAFPEIKGDPEYFTRPRSYQKAIESIKLSMMRADVEAKYKIPAVDFKIAYYHLKIADIEKKQKKDFMESLKKAEAYFSSASIKSDFPNITLEMTCIYQVVALNLYLGNRTKAAEFLKITKNAVRQRTTAVKLNAIPENKAALSETTKWDNRISLLWEYRDDTDYWKDVF